MNVLKYIKFLTFILAVLFFVDGYRVAHENRKLQSEITEMRSASLDLQKENDQLTKQLANVASADQSSVTANLRKQIEMLEQQIRSLGAEIDENIGQEASLLSDLQECESRTQNPVDRKTRQEAFQALSSFLGLQREEIRSSADLSRLLSNPERQETLGRNLCTTFAGNYLKRLNALVGDQNRILTADDAKEENTPNKDDKKPAEPEKTAQ